MKEKVNKCRLRSLNDLNLHFAYYWTPENYTYYWFRCHYPLITYLRIIIQFFLTTGETELPSPTIQEEFRRLKLIKASGKVRQIEINVSTRDQAIIKFSTANNIIEEYNFDLTDAKNAEPVKMRTFDLQGHRSDARCLAFSSCNTAIASVSHETLKV